MLKYTRPPKTTETHPSYTGPDSRALLGVGAAGLVGVDLGPAVGVDGDVGGPADAEGVGAEGPADAVRVEAAGLTHPLARAARRRLPALTPDRGQA